MQNSDKITIFQPDIYDHVLTLLHEYQPKTVLDVGAGQGYMAKILQGENFEVSACDGDPSKFGAPGIECLAADFNSHIPFEDNTFDCCISIEVVEHVENHARFIREMIRVTKPGGIVIITTPNVLSLTSRVHYLWYGYTDCAPLPLSPTAEEYSQHINPISLPQILYHFGRNNTELCALRTNRIRLSSLLLFWLYPIAYILLKRNLFRKKYTSERQLFTKRSFKFKVQHLFFDC